jgi:hypothetical protein
MARDASRWVRMAVINRLKSIASPIPTDRIYPQQIPTSPVWPYGFVGVPITTPDTAGCLDGSIVRFAVHGYARTVSGGDPGETAANKIGEAFSAALGGATLTLAAPYASDCDLAWISNTTVRDPSEASAFHVICQFEARVSS